MNPNPTCPNPLSPASPADDRPSQPPVFCLTCRSAVPAEQLKLCPNSSRVRLSFDVCRCAAEACPRMLDCARAMVPGNEFSVHSDYSTSWPENGDCRAFRAIEGAGDGRSVSRRIAVQKKGSKK
jgi:hypothetical protein